MRGVMSFAAGASGCSSHRGSNASWTRLQSSTIPGCSLFDPPPQGLALGDVLPHLDPQHVGAVDGVAGDLAHRLRLVVAEIDQAAHPVVDLGGVAPHALRPARNLLHAPYVGGEIRVAGGDDPVRALSHEIARLRRPAGDVDGQLPARPLRPEPDSSPFHLFPRAVALDEGHRLSQRGEGRRPGEDTLLGAVRPVPKDEGCPFRARCPFVIEGTCDSRTPPARKLSETLDHVVYCHRNVAAPA